MTVQTSRIRNRARNPAAARRSVSPKMRDLVEFKFSEGLEQQFAHILKISSQASEAAMDDLTEIARSYLTWKATPVSSREIVRSELHHIAQLRSVDELQALLPKLDKDTEHHLWARLLSASDWPEGRITVHWLRSEPDLAKVKTAAALAAAAMRGGDYANIDLPVAVLLLVDLFEAYSSQKTTVGRPDSSAPLPSLARLFFEQVDPELKWTTIWNALDQEVRARKQRAAR